MPQAKKRLTDGGDSARSGEKALIQALERKQATDKLDELGIGHTGVDDLGALRMILSHHLDLGVLDEAAWTKKGITYAVNEILLLAKSPKEIGTGRKATEFLRAALLQKEADVNKRLFPPTKPTKTPDDEFGLAKMSPETRRKLSAKIAEIEKEAADKAIAGRKTAGRGNLKGQKNPRVELIEGTFDQVWRDTTTVCADEYIKFTAAQGERQLSDGVFNWNDLMNTRTAYEYMPENYAAERHRGMHFYTVVAKLCHELPRIVSQDTTGFGEMAIMEGNEETAHEWLSTMATIGIKRMGSGATFSQIGLSSTANTGMAGGTASGTLPVHMVTSFSQLFMAGEKHQKLRPKTPGNSSSSAVDPEDFTIPEERINELTDMYLAAAPEGVTRATVNRCVRVQASCKGASFKAKQGNYWKDFAGKMTGVGTATGEGGGYTVAPGFRRGKAHISLAGECAREGKRTAALCDYIGLQSDMITLLLHAMATRNFASTKYGSSKFVPADRTNLTAAELAKGFGFFERGIKPSGYVDPGTKEGDRELYEALSCGLVFMRAFEVPALDLGFAVELSWWHSEVEGFRLSGLPFVLVMMELGLLLVTAQRQRDQALSHGTSDETTELSFQTTERIETGKRLLLERANRACDFEQVMIARMSQEIQSGKPTHAAWGSGQQRANRPPPNADGGKPRGAPRQAIPHGGGGQQVPPQQTRQHAPVAPKDGQGKKAAVHQELDKQKWHRAYGGEKDAAAKSPCWFYANRPGGCLQTDATCTKSHAIRPKEYGGKHWDELDGASKKKIAARVAAA